LEFHEVSVDQATGSITLRAKFPNPHDVLLPGMYVRAVLDEAVDKNALLAPQQGITRDARGNALAMIVDGGNRVEERSVVTGRAIGSDWLITSGLSAGERLIIQGLNKVHAGDPVVPVSMDADAPRTAGRSTEADLASAGVAARGEDAGTAARHVSPSPEHGSLDQ
jgi:membrane fusion protein (multidrug efflux system)